MTDFKQFEILTFDCYGTLIDWESGILNSMKEVLKRHGVGVENNEILERYADFESAAESGPYILYREVLRSVMWQFGKHFNFVPKPEDDFAIAESMKDWRPFEDTVGSLRTLKERYQLAIFSNVDDDLFAATAEKLRVDFDKVITAGQLQCYKPSAQFFERAVELIGLPKEKILHVAQSLYHDVEPMKKLGIKSVWVNRRTGTGCRGATPPADVVPDIEVSDLRSLVKITG